MKALPAAHLLTIALFAISTMSCDGKQKASGPLPPTVNADVPVTFWFDSKEGVGKYELTADQARLIVSLLRSPPSGTYTKEEWEWLTVAPPGEFTIADYRFRYQGGWLQYVDDDLNVFVWDHPFLGHLLPGIPPHPYIAEERFETMKDYDWPEHTK